jgi:hypothetical protein
MEIIKTSFELLRNGYSRYFIMNYTCWHPIHLLTFLCIKQKYLGTYSLPKYSEEDGSLLEEADEVYAYRSAMERSRYQPSFSSGGSMSAVSVRTGSE